MDEKLIPMLAVICSYDRGQRDKVTKRAEELGYRAFVLILNSEKGVSFSEKIMKIAALHKFEKEEFQEIWFLGRLLHSLDFLRLLIREGKDKVTFRNCTDNPSPLYSKLEYYLKGDPLVKLQTNKLLAQGSSGS